MNQSNFIQNPNALFQRGFQSQQNGNLEEAERFYRNVLQLSASHVGAKTMLGLICIGSKRDNEGIKLLEFSLLKDPKQFWAHNGLGIGYLNIKQYQKAFQSFNKAISLNPNYIEAYFNLGKAQTALQRYQDAIISYSKCLMLNENYVDAYINRGSVYLEDLKEYDKALSDYERVTKLLPDSWSSFHRIGIVYTELKRYDDALESFDHALKLKPDDANTCFNRGIIYTELKRYEDALESYDHALQLRPDYAEAYINCGDVFVKLKRYEDALDSYDQALQLRPDYAEAYINFGVVYTELKRYDDALESFDRALELKSEMDYILGYFISVKMIVCDWKDYSQTLDNMLSKIPRKNKISVPFIGITITDDPDTQKQLAEIYVSDKYPNNNVLQKGSKLPKHEKIRIGYFSNDFREHPVAYLTAELIELHNRDRFEVIAFSFGVNTQDPFRKRLQKSFDQFLDVRGNTDQQITQLSREMEIDIAIDLGGFTAECRTNVFAMRAAPVQVNYLGYPGTMGAEYMDYIIADRTVIPSEQTVHYSEKVAYLPDSFMTSDSSLKISEETYNRDQFGLPENAFIFCCFNASYKITPPTFIGWMRILKAVDNSVLWLSGMNQTAINNLKVKAVECGVNCDRIIFASRLPLASEHLKRIQLADLFLDTFPYNAHTTANDALRVGLPVLTKIGRSFASRVAGSLLNVLELQELITKNQESYESLAIELATNSEKLQLIKKKLLRNLSSAPLYNSKLFTKGIESAYEAMYQRYQNDLPPDHLYIKS